MVVEAWYLWQNTCEVSTAILADDMLACWVCRGDTYRVSYPFRSVLLDQMRICHFLCMSLALIYGSQLTTHNPLIASPEMKWPLTPESQNKIKQTKNNNK